MIGESAVKVNRVDDNMACAERGKFTRQSGGLSIQNTFIQILLAQKAYEGLVQRFAINQFQVRFEIAHQETCPSFPS